MNFKEIEHSTAFWIILCEHYAMAFALTPLVDYLVPKVVWTYRQLNNSTLKSVATLLTHYVLYIQAR